MSNITPNADPKTDAEYSRELEALLAEMAEMDEVLARMGKSCLERSVSRRN